ncbi:MAG TPA: helix-turn-helix transcriptional regulator [Vicinamibacterales bacterium]
MDHRADSSSHRITVLKRDRQTREPAHRLPVPPDQLLSLVAAGDLDTLADAAFSALAAAVRCDSVSVFYQSAGSHLLQERDSNGRRYGAEFTALHARLSPAIPITMANPGIKLVPTRTGLPRDDLELRASEFYREVMQVQGWRHAVALCFWDGPPPREPVLVFTVKRAEGEPDFSDDDLADLETMHAFIEPAVRRIRELATATAVSNAFAAPLRHDERGVAVLDAALRVVEANVACRRLLKRGLSAGTHRTRPRRAGNIDIPPAVIAACRELKADRLHDLLDGGTARLFRRRNVSVPGDPTLECLITMVSHDHGGMAEPSFVVEIAALPPNERAGGPALAAVPGITGAEREVAAALAEGLSNQEIADRLGKTIHAVKFLLHRIYHKTGIANRVGLVARLRSERVRHGKGRAQG